MVKTVLPLLARCPPAQDESELHERSATDADTLQRMLAELRTAHQSVFAPDRGKVDPGACAQALSEANGGFWGPWLE